MNNISYIKIIEMLNKENIDSTYRCNDIGALIKTWLKQRFGSNLLDKILCKIRFMKIKNNEATENWTNTEWYSLLKPGNPDLKVVIYTCITGGYDIPKRPVYYPENVVYILFTTEVEEDSELNGWSAKPIPENIKSQYDNTTINRYIKFHSHELFSESYDIAIYIDGNITVVSDLSVLEELINKDIGLAIHNHYCRSCIYEELKACMALKKGNEINLKKQVALYKQQGFPRDYGLLECNVLVTDLKSEKAKIIYDQWWEEFLKSGSGRDQIALPYVLWKNDIKISDIGTLGRNVYRNPKIRVVNHLSNSK